MEKAKIRFTKYSSWLLVNFVLCILPLILSAIISRKIDDNIITSYISFTYTILISGLYVYKNSGKENELIFWLTFILTVICLGLYILFPKLFSQNFNNYIRCNSFVIGLIILFVVIFFSFLLNFRSIEEQVDRLLIKRPQESAAKVESNVRGYYETLKRESHEN